MTRIDGQIGLLRTAGVTGADTRVDGPTGLLGIAGVSRTTTLVGGQTGLLGTTGVTRMVAQVSRQTGLLGSAVVMKTATRSREILVGLQKIWLTRKSSYGKFGYYTKPGYTEFG
jgi:hypothetical protein